MEALKRKWAALLGIDREQQKLLREFFANLTTWRPKDVGLKVIAIIWACLALLCSWMGGNQGENVLYWLMMAAGQEFIGSTSYIASCSVFADDRKAESGDVLAYLPISKHQLNLFRLKMVAKYCLISAGIVLLGQILIAVIEQQVVLVRILPFPCIMLAPVVCWGIVCMLDRK